MPPGGWVTPAAPWICSWPGGGTPTQERPSEQLSGGGFFAQAAGAKLEEALDGQCHLGFRKSRELLTVGTHGIADQLLGEVNVVEHAAAQKGLG